MVTTKTTSHAITGYRAQMKVMRHNTQDGRYAICIEDKGFEFSAREFLSLAASILTVLEQDGKGVDWRSVKLKDDLGERPPSSNKSDQLN